MQLAVSGWVRHEPLMKVSNVQVYWIWLKNIATSLFSELVTLSYLAFNASLYHASYKGSIMRAKKGFIMRATKGLSCELQRVYHASYKVQAFLGWAGCYRKPRAERTSSEWKTCGKDWPVMLAWACMARAAGTASPAWNLSERGTATCLCKK